MAGYIESDEREKPTTKDTLPSKTLLQIWWRNQKFSRQAKVKRIQYHQRSFTTKAKGTSSGRKHKRRERLTENKPKRIKKMVIGSYISITTLNLNGLNASTKRHRLAGQMQTCTYMHFHLPQHPAWLSKLYVIILHWASLVAQMVKNPPAILEIWVQSLGWEDSPRGGHGNPLQYSYLDRGAWQDPWGHKELDTTEWLSTAHVPIMACNCNYLFFWSGYWLWKLINIFYYCDYVTSTQYHCIMIGQQENYRILYHQNYHLIEKPLIAF